MENKTKARCQLGNKAMKIKLTNMLVCWEVCWEERRKRKERMNRYAKLNRGRQRRFIYIKD